MSILVLGGTQFVGRHIVEALLSRGHSVTMFNRGQTADDLPRNVERLRGDRDAGAAGLHALRDRSWDACVDVSGYTPRQVRATAQMLRNHVGRYVFISAVSVYSDPQDRPVRESHPRVRPAEEHVTEVVGEMYGRLKVTCENMVEELFGLRSAILRPQIVAGAHDPFDRYSYWVRRVDAQKRAGGEVPAPGDGSDHVQVVDAADLASFACMVIERGLSGAFNIAGPRQTWADFLSGLGASDLVWIPTEVIRAAGVGEDELPLFRAELGPRSGLMDVCAKRATAAGLTLSDPAATARRVRAWLPDCRLAPALSPEREAELIALTRQERSR